MRGNRVTIGKGKASVIINAVYIGVRHLPNGGPYPTVMICHEYQDIGMTIV